MGISTPLDTPFHGSYATPGAAQIITPDVPYFLPVAINGHPYQVDLTQYASDTIQAQRQPVDQSMEPGEQTLNTEGLWRRSQENWVLGCNQYYLDNIASLYSLYERAGENQSLRYRFWVSKNVNVWTSGQMTLLPLTEAKYTETGTGLSKLTAIPIGNYLYVVQGTSVQYTSNPTSSSPTWTTYAFQGGSPQPITSITTDGTNLYAACGSNGVYVIPPGVTSGAATLGTIHPDFIVYGNGRLICGTGPLLQELNHDGTITAIGSHLNPAWFWTFGCSAPGAIYVGGAATNIGEVYEVTIATSGTSLNPPALAAPLPPGENPLCITFTGGYIVIGTSVGLRIADITSTTTNGLNFGPVITIPGGVNCVAAWGEYVYFGWCKFVCPSPTLPSVTVQSSGLGRADLGRFTSALVPAYTTDLQLDDSATSSTNFTVSSVAMINGLPYFTALNAALTVAYVAGANATKYAAAGMFQSGWTRFNTVEPKVVASIDYHHDLLLGGSVGAFLLLENGTTISLPTSGTLGTLGPPSPFSTNFQAGEAFNTQVYLQPDNATQTISPTLRRYTVRALITPRRMNEIVLPIVMRTKVKGLQGEGEDIWQDTLVESQFLQDLCNRGVIVTYQEGASTYQCYIDRVQVKPQKWRDDRGFFEGLVLCRLLTIPPD